jgi:hypothetical protein
MKNKIEHTPGPWEMGGSLLASTSGKHIAIVLHNINYDEKKLPRDYDSRAPKSFPETEANARLIAAAPELLAALENLVIWRDPSHPDHEEMQQGLYENRADNEQIPSSDAIEAELIEAARASIRKAKGEV